MESDRKWILLSYIALTLLCSWILNNVLVLVVGYLRVRNPMVLGVIPATGIIATVAVSTFAVFYLRQDKVKNYVTEVVQELRKVSWPVRRDTYLSTMVVIVAVILMALVLGVYDWACGRFIGFILRV